MTRKAGALGKRTPEILDTLELFIKRNDGATREEMAAHLGLKHKSSAQAYLRLLVKQSRAKIYGNGFVRILEKTQEPK